MMTLSASGIQSRPRHTSHPQTWVGRSRAGISRMACNADTNTPDVGHVFVGEIMGVHDFRAGGREDRLQVFL